MNTLHLWTYVKSSLGYFVYCRFVVSISSSIYDVLSQRFGFGGFPEVSNENISGDCDLVHNLDWKDR